MPSRTSQIARQVATRFDLEIHGVEIVKEKTDSLVCKLRGESRNVFLKLWTGSFSSERVHQQAALLEYLSDVGFSAPTLVKDDSGHRLFEGRLDLAPACGYLTEEIQIAAPGIDVDDEAQLRLAARKLADFHLRTDALERGFTRVEWSHYWLIDRNLQILEPLFSERRADFESLCSMFGHLRARLREAWTRTEGTWGIVHGDWHATNVVLSADGDLWFLDFESFGYGWRINDVVYLLASPVDTAGPLDLAPLRERYAVFMDEYSQRGPDIAGSTGFPASWLSVRLLLHFARQVQALGVDDFDATRAARWIDAFMEKVALLERAR